MFAGFPVCNNVIDAKYRLSKAFAHYMLLWALEVMQRSTIYKSSDIKIKSFGKL